MSSSIEGYRLSPAQQRLWTQSEGIGAHSVTAVVSIAGLDDPRRLVEALFAAAAPYDVLRTTFVRLAGMPLPVQVVHDSLPPRVTIDHLRDGCEEEILRRIDALRRTPVNLERGPVWEATLLDHGEGNATLLLAWPPLVGDEHTARLLIRRLGEALDGRSSMAPDDALQYVDVAEWHHQLLESPGTGVGRDFWRLLSCDAVGRSRLPLRRHAAVEGAFEPSTVSVPLPCEIDRACARWAEAHGCSLEELFLACWHLLLWRLGDESTLVIGCASDGRGQPDLRDVAGPLARMLPVRFSLEPRWTCAELASRSGEALRAHRRWSDLFDWSLLGASGEEGTRFCPLAFQMSAPHPSLTSGGVRLEIRAVHGVGERFELALAVTPTDDAREVSVRWDPRVHTTAQAEAIAAQYACVLRQVVADAAASLDAVHLEVAVASGILAGEPLSIDAELTVSALFDAQALAHPARLAATCGEEQVTYSDLNARAERVADFLAAQGAGPEARVGVLLEHSIDLLAVVLGVLKAGAAVVPLPPDVPLPRLARLAERTKAPFVLSHRGIASGWPSDSPSRLVNLEEIERGAFGRHRRTLPKPDNLAYVMFTSGSTGEPKGVMISHRAFVNYTSWCRAAYLDGDRRDVPLHSSVGFDATLTSLLAPLCAGAHVFVIAEREASLGAHALADGRDFAFVKVTPAHLPLVASAATAEAVGGITSTLVVGGEALVAEQLDAWRVHAPQVRIINEYGPTEATVGCVVHVARAGAIDPGRVPIGRPLPNVACRVVDRFGVEAAVGVAGELYVAGVQLARGYESSPDLTADRFVPGPPAESSGTRWYRTGDVVRRRADGLLEYVGRRDQQVKLRGYRVEPAEIEIACRRQTGVRDAAVVLRERGARELVAYVVPERGATLASDTLQDALRRELPSYMVPGTIVFLDALPLTTNGKVDRARLPEPGPARPQLARPFAAPRNDVERLLAGIWASVLRRDRVGISDNFFALGGDSILSLQIVARAARAGLRLTPRALFERPTVAALAEAVDASLPLQTAPPLDEGPIPLSPVQQWFFERRLTAPHQFNYATVLEPIAVGPAQIASGWLALQTRHEAFRLRFRRDTDGWTQERAVETAASPATVVDLTAVDPARVETLWSHIADSAQASLDLAAGPIARAVIAVGPGAPRVLLVVHHLAVDGVSARVLLEDFGALCATSGPLVEEARQSAKGTTFGVWARRLSSAARDGLFDCHLPFWREMSLPAARLPRDRASGPNDQRSQRTFRCSLGAAETSRLVHRLPSELGVHVQDALVAAVVDAFATRGGAAAWRIDLEGHGRDALDDTGDLARTVGWFTSMYPVRVVLPTERDLRETLRATRQVLRRVPGSGASYGALRYYGAGDAMGLRAADDSDVLLNYWGVLDTPGAGEGALRQTRLPVGALRHPEQARSHLIEISASVSDGRLHMLWTYSVNVHDASRIELLGTQVLETLRRAGDLPADAKGGLQCAAEFPLAAASDAEVSALVARGGALSNMYPLSPLQEGLLFHHLREHDGRHYAQQCDAVVTGALDLDAFRAAWQDATARHDALRTAFVWDRRERPLQVVYDHAALPWHLEDLRSLAPAEQQARLGAFREADLERGFALDAAPLMRLAVFRLADEAWEIFWTSHHLILDGWSVQVVLRDVFDAYFARRRGESLEPTGVAGAYASYIAWLERQDHTRTEAFWRSALAGVHAPPLWTRRDGAAGRTALARRTLQATLDPSVVAELRSLASARGLTMNTWLAGTLAVILAYCAKADEAVFGAVVSGRPPEVPGIETTAGLFANTIPIRVPVPRDATASTFFAECQRRQLDARDHGYASLGRIQQWSGRAPGAPLVETVFAYDNYPIAQTWYERRELHIERMGTAVPTPYPLVIDVNESAAELTVSLAFDDERIDVPLARFILEAFGLVLSRFVREADCSVAALQEALDSRASSARAVGRREARRRALQTRQRAVSTPPAV